MVTRTEEKAVREGHMHPLEVKGKSMRLRKIKSGIKRRSRKNKRSKRNSRRYSRYSRMRGGDYFSSAKYKKTYYDPEHTEENLILKKAGKKGGDVLLEKFITVKKEQMEKLKHLHTIKYETVNKERSGKVLTTDFHNIKINEMAKAKLPYNILQFFRYVAGMDYEVGGFLDFDDGTKLKNKGKKFRLITYFGESTALDFPNLDFEVEWHTHPDDPPGIYNPPSGSDIIGLLRASVTLGTQVSLVISKHFLYVMYPENLFFTAYTRLTDAEQHELDKVIIKHTDDAYEKSLKTKDTSYFEQAMKDVGFVMIEYKFGSDWMGNFTLSKRDEYGKWKTVREQDFSLPIHIVSAT